MNSQLEKIKRLIDKLSEKIPDLYIHGMTLDCGSMERETIYLEPFITPKYHITTRIDMKDNYISIVGEGIRSGYISIEDLIGFLKEEIV